MEKRKNIFKRFGGMVQHVAAMAGKTVQSVFDSQWFQRLDERYMSWRLIGNRDIKVAEVIFYFSSGLGQGKVWQRAKGLSYSLLMALPPLLVFLFTLVAYLPIDGIQDELLRQMEQFIPPNFYTKIADTVNDVMGHKHSSLMSIGFIVSIILASNGIYGCYRSINYNQSLTTRKGFLPVYGVSILMVFLLFVMLAAAMALLVGYKIMLFFLMKRNIIAPTKLSLVVFSTGRWIILVMLTLLVLNVIYRFVIAEKRQKQSLRFFSIGSVVSTVLFFGLTWGFRIYLTYFNRFNLLYGSIGTILMVMLWLFAICYVLLIGYEVNLSVIKSADDPDKWEENRFEKRLQRKAKRLREVYLSPEERDRLEQEELQREAERLKAKAEPQTMVVEITMQRDADGWAAVDTKLKNKE